MIRQLDEIKFHEPRLNHKNNHVSKATSLDEEKEHTDAEVCFKIFKCVHKSGFNKFYIIYRFLK